ncbi:Cof-type HAD-IIB family hydrolase [Eubacteriaceae bacterium ES3]|nr:Cof-type HAD-IIB family hydrolase [Eubacteriaceae bacterium ES3]
MNIKLIALDLDGTTLKSDFKSITKKTEDTLKAAIEQGIHVVPSTGRILGQLPESVTSIPGINYAVTSNGASVVNLRTKEVISSQYIGAGTIKKIMPVLSRKKLFCEVYHKGQSYAEHRFFESIEDIKEFPPDLIDFIKNKSTAVDSIAEFTMANAGEIEKINIPLLSDQNHRRLWQRFSQIRGVTLTQALASNIEVNHRDSNKGRGLKALCKLLEVKQSEVMALGDSDNDIKMLEFAGLPVAMGNASDDVKAVAKVVTLRFDEDGLAHAIEKYALNK